MASAISSMFAAASVQHPLMPVMDSHQASGNAIFGPMSLDILRQFPAFYAHLPQDASADAKVCVSITGPSKCSDLAILAKEDWSELEDCSITVGDCEVFQRRADTNGNDDATASFDGQDDSERDIEDLSDTDGEGEDSDMEAEDELDSGDDEDIFTDSQPAAVSATATSAPEDQTDLPVITTALKMARAQETGVPRSVQDALISDKNAARSLAKEFSGDKTPEWYRNLPKDQKHLFLGQRGTKAPKHPKATPEPGAIKYRHPSYSCLIKVPKEEYVRYDLEAKQAKHYSRIAKDMSKAAERISCSEMSKAARTVSQDASKAHAQAEASKKALKKRHPKQYKKAEKTNAASSTVAVPKSSALFAVSFMVAVATLGVALCL